MQLVGIGFSKKSWNSLTKSLQKHLCHQLNPELFVDPQLNSALVKESEDMQNITVKISNLKPDWIIFYSKYFENPVSFLKLIDILKKTSSKKIYFVMVLDNIKKNFNSFIKFLPEFELVNKMNFKLSTPELIIDQRIKTFPRIRLNSEFNKIKYRNNFGDLVNYSAEEIPENSLIPLKCIDAFETDIGEVAPKKWVKKILEQKYLDIKYQQVLGILREKKGCYFFPGIPFNSILNLKINNIKIDHLILSEEYEIKNPTFNRLVKKMKVEYKSWEGANNELFEVDCSPIYGYTKDLILKNFLEDIFIEMGRPNVKIVSDLNLLKNIFKGPVNWLSFDDSFIPSENINNIDWSVDYKNIISPYKNLIDLGELEIIKKVNVLPLHKSELEENLEKISITEIEINNLIKKLELDKKINSQKLEVLKRLDSLTKILINVLSCSINWDTAYERSSKIMNKKILLFCEEESRAAELNLKLKAVNKKLWINPFKFKEPEDLVQLNTKMIKSYLRPGGVVINREAKNYLENLCIQTKKEHEITKLHINEQILKIKHYKTDLKLISKNKKNLALRWLKVSLKQLVYRDRNLFK